MRAVLTIDLGAIAANWRALDGLSGPGVETAAVVKADAYGLGAAAVGPALRDAGARSFFVALAEEGAVLREALGPGPSVRILSGFMRGDGDLCRAFALEPCLNSVEQVRSFAREMPGGRAAVQVDSGMHRLGLSAADLVEVSDVLARIGPDLVMSHLACADAPLDRRNEAQRRAFLVMSESVPAARRSLAATGGILLGGEYHFDMVRPGVGLFGGLPFAAALPVVRLALPVIQVRDVAPGGGVGYGAAWVAERPSRVATVSGGYADGLHRALANGAVGLYAGGRRCPLIGRISMDLIAADVTEIGEVPETLEILNAEQRVDDLAQAAGTIGYEILTGLGDRYQRVYVGGAGESA